MNVLLVLPVLSAAVALSIAVQPLGAGFNSRCVCVYLESRMIPPDTLRRVEILPKSPHCRSTEVIAGLWSGESICLNPRTPWVKRLVLYIEKKGRVTKKDTHSLSSSDTLI